MKRSIPVGDFSNFYDGSGIEHQLTAPYTPQQNGVSERKNRSIMEMTRCMLHEKELPKKLWAEAANTSMYLLNRMPTRALQKKLLLKLDLDTNQTCNI
jgi:transposase InsO family protein